ncbi:MAG TPA: hypothetical protein VGM54_22455 [Chthoniobacter sp.]|jgi:hypothetical protein
MGGCYDWKSTLRRREDVWKKLKDEGGETKDEGGGMKDEEYGRFAGVGDKSAFGIVSVS